MLIRLRVLPESVNPQDKTFQARSQVTGVSEDDLQNIARDLEAGAVTRFYRGGEPHGRVLTARVTGDTLWLKARIPPGDGESWRLVESGAVSTVEIQRLPRGVDVFLKSVAATYPSLSP